MNKRTLTLLLAIIAAPLLSALDVPRLDQRIDDGWKFSLIDDATNSSVNLDDSKWRSIDLPHDWSIESKTDPKASMGGSGGFFPSGIGWYRMKFEAPKSWAGKKVEVEFDGVYQNTTVYLNGKILLTQHYGYTSFFVDLTRDLKLGNTNVLSVRVDNSEQKNSRWYAGSGIYRHVRLHVSNPLRVSNWGVFVATEIATKERADLSVSTEIINPDDAVANLKVVSEVMGPNGSLGSVTTPVDVPKNGAKKITSNVTVKSPPLWSPEDPKMCRIITRVVQASDDSVLDYVVTPFGIRKLAWSVADGFTINGKTYKIKGGCVHADNGVLGACAFDRAEERKVEILKAAGFNAIRTAHNPYSPAFLDACDRLGMMVMENCFDCWTRGKVTCDYARYFKDDWKSDLDTMVLRDRNHPSIVLWDIGNEVPWIFTHPDVASYAPRLVKETHSLDSTRPVTIASCSWPNDKDVPTAEVSWSAQDIVGANYQIEKHVKRHDQFPNRVLLSTESFNPLGEYNAVLNNPYVIGDFVWTAQDYLGEVGIGRSFVIGDPSEPLKQPDPKKPGEILPERASSDSLYPWHGASCGLVDILGFPKPMTNYWNVVWKTDRVKLGMAVLEPESDTKKIKHTSWGWFPSWASWTWPGWEGKSMQVEVYSTYPKSRLYLNSKLVAEQGMSNGKTTYKLNFEPGVLKAVALDAANNEVEETQYVTAGEAAAISLKPDRETIAADGQDLSFVKIEVVDKNGQLNPNAYESIHFTVTGPGKIAGLGNANMKDETPYQGEDCRVDHGKALVVIRSKHDAGKIVLKATSSGLTSAETSITSK